MVKKWLIVVASISILSFLVLRLFNKHVDAVKSERQMYIAQLNFEFSAIIDSVRLRHVIFHLKEYDIDWNQEKNANRRLEHNGRLDLFLYRSNHKIELMIANADRYSKGDSIYLNSSKNLVRVYRDHELLSEYTLLESLKGRPF